MLVSRRLAWVLVQFSIGLGFFGMMGLGLSLYWLTGKFVFISWAWTLLQASVGASCGLLLGRYWKLGVFAEKEFGHYGEEDSFEGWN